MQHTFGCLYALDTPSSCIFSVFYLEVLQLNLQIPFMMHVPLRQEHGMTVISSLTEYFDGNLYIKVDFTFTALWEQQETGNINV